MGAVIAVVLLGAFMTALWVGQRRLIYFPDNAVPRLGTASEWEEVSFSTADGVTLAAWLRSPAESRPVVIVFNGNAGNRGDRLSLGERLADAGMGVLLTDYRGYGGNPGRPTEDGLALDARAAAEFLRTRTPEHPLVYFGESLGAAVAIELATAQPPAALILRSPFSSMTAVGRHHYPWLPVSALLKDRYPSDEVIGLVEVPTLVVVGAADSIVPPSQSREIYEAASGIKQLVVIEGADHNDAELVAGREVISSILEFLDQSGVP